MIVGFHAENMFKNFKSEFCFTMKYLRNKLYRPTHLSKKCYFIFQAVRSTHGMEVPLAFDVDCKVSDQVFFVV